MALFVARPSRSSWAFFGLVVLGVLAAWGVRDHERSVVRRDAPAAELAQDLAACVLGSDSSWLLAGPDGAAWQEAIGTWMRRVVSARQVPAWPGRCVPVAESLAAKLQSNGSNVPQNVNDSVAAVLRSLQDGARDPFVRVELADSDQLPRQLADLLDKVRTLSQGSREGWRTVPLHFDRYGTLAAPAAPRLRTLPDALTRPALASGEALTVFSTADGAAHVYQLGSGAPHDVPLGAGVPWGGARDGVVRVETDQGAAWALVGATPRLLPMPTDFRVDGDPALATWDAAVTPRYFALVHVDQGTARLRVASRTTPAAWLPPEVVGSEESVSAAVVANAGDGWRVTTLRPQASDSVIEQYVVTPSLLSGEISVTGPARLGDDVASFGARVLTCASGDVRFFTLVGDQTITTLRVAGDEVRSTRTAAMWPRGREVSLTCDAGRALVSAVPAMPRGGHFVFSFDRRAGDIVTPLEPPARGPQASVRAVALVRDGVIALVSNASSLRAYRLVSRPGAREVAQWAPAGLAALAAPAPLWVRSFYRVEVATTGDEVAMIVAGDLRHRAPPPPPGQEPPAAPPPEAPPVPYVSVVGSHDGGATFWSL